MTSDSDVTPARDEIHCALDVFSASLTPEEITHRIGTQPTIVRRRGSRPRPGAGPKDGLPENQWEWNPDASVPLTLDAQLDAIWTALGSRAQAFRDLSEAHVVVDILIEHHGDGLSLGWAMVERHVLMAAALGASISVDEYDYTRENYM
jgi:hypothetical protein